MAIVEDNGQEQEVKGPGIIKQAALLAAATLLAAGIGIGASFFFDAAASSDEAEAAGEPAGEAQSLREMNEAGSVIYLDPITTNMAGATDMWVRLEMGLVFDGAPDAELAREVQGDTLAFLRTVKAHQVEGASGYRHFRADLKERAVTRSEGKITGILIRTLLFE